MNTPKSKVAMRAYAFSNRTSLCSFSITVSFENVAQPAEVALLSHLVHCRNSATSAGCATFASVFQSFPRVATRSEGSSFDVKENPRGKRLILRPGPTFTGRRVLFDLLGHLTQHIREVLRVP